MSTRVQQVLAAGYLTFCLLLGGASAAGALANGALQAAGLIIILVLLWMRGKGKLPVESKGLLWVVSLFVALTLLSLVPLPPSIWDSLPMRGEIERSLGLMGIRDPWLPWSLAPHQTASSILALIPPVAIFLLAAQLNADARRVLPGVVLVVALASIALGIFQLMGGPRSSLRFYEITNENAAVGFFANRNHQATLLLCALPLAGFLAARLVSGRRGRSRRSGGTIISIAASIFLVLGIALLGSEAGYAIFLPVALGSLLIYRRTAKGRLGPRWIAALGILSLIFLVIALVGPLSRETLAGKFSDSPTSRKEIAQTTLQAISDYMPFGTGLGSFANVYRTYENPADARREFVNHAHNDYLELALEFGVFSVLLVLGFIIWWARRTIYVWRNDFNGAALARAASVMIGVVLLHSLVDYPLRTSAIAAIFALACGFLLPAPAPGADKTVRRSAGENGALRHLEVA